MKRLLLVFGLISVLNANSQWQNEGPGTFTSAGAYYLDLAFDDDTAYIAFRDDANSNRASLMKFDGTNYVYVGTPGFSAGGAQSTKLAFFNNFPHVAYVDGANGNGATVMAFNGANWVDIGSAGFSAGGVSDINLEFDGSTAYVAYADWNAGGQATVMNFVAGTWQNVGTAGFTAGVANDLSFTMIGGTPYVAYQDMAFSNLISVMYYDGANWVYLGSQGISSGEGDHPVITNDGTNIYVAYRDLTAGQETTVMKFDGTSWSIVGATLMSPGGTSDLSIACLDTIPYVAYKDGANGFRASVRKFDGSSWVDVGNTGFSSSQALYNSIAFKDTVPYLAFQDFDGGNYTGTLMKYIPCIDPETPTVTYSATDLCQGESFTITIDAGNLNDATAWHVYAGGCTGSSVANSATGPFTIFPTGSATYSIRGEGGCVGFIPCIASQAVNVTPVDTNVTFSGGEFSVGAGAASSYQWLDCNNAMAPWIGDTNQVFIPPYDGSYAVEVTENGCTDTSSCHSVINVGIDHYENEFISIYPNPSHSDISIQLPYNGDSGSIEIYDLSGQLVYAMDYSSSYVVNINLDHLDAGIYLISVKSKTFQTAEKLIIEK